MIAIAIQGAGGQHRPRRPAAHRRAPQPQRPRHPPRLYDLWLECLIEAVRGHDPQFSAELESAWRETLAFGIDYMRARY